MKEQLALLDQLQQTDTQAEADERELEELDEGSSTQEALTQEEQSLEQSERELAATRARLHDKELQLQGTEDDRAAKWSQAYGGRVTDPKELQALVQKISELDRRKDRLEEEAIGLLDEVEAKEQALAKKTTEVDRLREKLHNIQQHHRSRTEQLKARLLDLRERRQALPAQLSPSLLAQYEQIRQKSGNLAVVTVEGGACGGCHTSLPSNYVTGLANPAQVMRCENCGRILVLPQRSGAGMH